MIRSAPETFGHYSIEKVRHSGSQANEYYDIWITSTNSEDTAALEVADIPTNKGQCCWNLLNPELSKRTNLNGFARVIQYYDDRYKGNRPKYMIRMWEGQVVKGEPIGFNRYIDGQDDISYIGYFDDNLKHYGTSLEFFTK